MYSEYMAITTNSVGLLRDSQRMCMPVVPVAGNADTDQGLLASLGKTWTLVCLCVSLFLLLPPTPIFGGGWDAFEMDLYSFD